ncbi:hypothetical protein ACF05T_14695 [Streptomyces lateritius]|uniref:Uncharacterized protein n=1 Tax=Streptomyces lateritius TaxID=67313 RepID=A0ABW6YBY1_9ACTN
MVIAEDATSLREGLAVLLPRRGTVATVGTVHEIRPLACGPDVASLDARTFLGFGDEGLRVASA